MLNSRQGERLQKVMAAAGVASRRVCEDLIAAGPRRGQRRDRSTEPGRRVLPTDRVTVDGTAIQTDTSKRYLMLNKPVGVVSLAAGRARPARPARVHRPLRGAPVQRRTTRCRDLRAADPHQRRRARARARAPVVRRDEDLHREGAGRGDRRRPSRKLTKGIDLDDGPIAADKARILGAASSGRDHGRDHAALRSQPHRAPDAGRGRSPGASSSCAASSARCTSAPSRSGRLRDLTKVELGETAHHLPGRSRRIRPRLPTQLEE